MVTARKRRPAKQPVAVPPLGGEGMIGTVEGVDEGASARKPLTPNQCRKYLRTTVAGAYPDIVAGFVREAKKGGCQHLKVATQVVQSNRRPKAVRREKSAATLMLEK